MNNVPDITIAIIIKLIPAIVVPVYGKFDGLLLSLALVLTLLVSVCTFDLSVVSILYD